MTISSLIDFHAHVLHPDVYAQSINHNVITAFGARPQAERPQPGAPRYDIYARMTDRARQVADMEARGIATHVVSAATTSQGTAWAEPEQAAALDRVANEQIAEWVRLSPGRFVGAFTMPLQDMRLAMAEFEHAVHDLGLRLVNLPANIGGRYLGEAYFDPLWQAMEHERLIAFIHPDGVRDPWFQDFSMWNGIGQGIEETRVMTSIVYNGVLDRFPGVQIVMPHGGGYLPFYVGRLDRNATAHPASVARISGVPSDYLRRFHYDTCVYDPWVVKAMIDRVGLDRLLLGSDYPVGEKDPVAFLRRCGLGDAEIEQVGSKNPRALLGDLVVAA